MIQDRFPVLLAAHASALVLTFPVHAAPTLSEGNTELERWESTVAGVWRADYEPGTSQPRSLCGRGVVPDDIPTSDEQYAALAQEYLTVFSRAFDFDASSFVLRVVDFLPLGLAGSSDKVVVKYDQFLHGTVVRGGGTSVVLESSGALLGIYTHALSRRAHPSFDGPDFPLERVLDLSRGALALEGEPTSPSRMRARVTSPPERIIHRHRCDAGVLGRFAWVTRLHVPEVNGFPSAAWRFVIDASSGEVLERWNEVRGADVSGRVRAWVTPAHPSTTPFAYPDDLFSGGVEVNPEVRLPLGGLRVRVVNGGPSTVTAPDGSFTLNGVHAPVTVELAYEGPSFRVVNAVAPDPVRVATLTQGAGNEVVLNQRRSSTTTPSANAFHWANALSQWIVDAGGTEQPFGQTAPLPIELHVNAPATANGICAASYEPPNRVRFTLASSPCSSVISCIPANTACPGPASDAGACTNKSNAAVILHELGHYLTDFYFPGSVSSAFDEGLSDAWALYVTGQSEFGAHWCAAHSCFRSGTNTVLFCGDHANGSENLTCLGCQVNGCTSPCVFNSHYKGQILMGALWKVRVELEAAFGRIPGAEIANRLFMAWMELGQDFSIVSAIQAHWLDLDDDDGQASNGTPHGMQIRAGFAAQGFPPAPGYPYL